MRTSQEDREMRIRCLEIATGSQISVSPDFDAAGVVYRARAYYDFVTGTSDLTPRQKIDAALDQSNVN
jgi:hypothetical protein